MIDPRSREHLEHPFPGVDGEHVVVVGPGPYAGYQGVVQHQVEHGLTGVVCRVRLSPGGESADIPASRLHFLPEEARPRDLRSVMHRPRATPGPRFVVVPTGWGVLDRRSGRPVAGHGELTYEAAEAVADALEHGDGDALQEQPAP